MRKGDTLIYYSPRQTRAGGEPVRAFTAVGVVADDEIVQRVFTGTVQSARVGQIEVAAAP